MKPEKDYEWYLKHDPCKLCVYCVNQYTESDTYPCSICMNFSEFAPEDGNYPGPTESEWVNDVVEFRACLDLIDDITEKIYQLNDKMPEVGIMYQAKDFLSYLNSLKRSSAKLWLFGDDYGGPCYDGGILVNCDECTKDTCPYRGE